MDIKTGLISSEGTEEIENTDDEYKMEEHLPFLFEKCYNFAIYIGKICFTFLAYGGFVMYTFFSTGLFLSPYLGLVSSCSIPDPIMIVTSLLKIILCYPLGELCLVIPFGIFWEFLSGKRGAAPLSPLFWTLEFLDYAKNIYSSKKALSITILISVTLSYLILLLNIANYLFGQGYTSSYIITILILLPSIVGIYNVGSILVKCWKFMFKPRIDVDLKEPTGEEDVKHGWPVIMLWENYIDDYETDSFRKSKKCNAKMAIGLILVILFIALISLEIVVLSQTFTIYFLFSLIIDIVFFPLLLRYNIFKNILNKDVEKRHQRFKKYTTILMIVHIIIWVLFGVYINKFVNKVPKYPTQAVWKNTSGIPVVNTEAAFEMPQYCLTNISSYNIVELMGIAGLPYYIKGGNDTLHSNFELIFGENWNRTIKIKSITNQKRLVLLHFFDTEKNVDVISIKGATTSSEMGLMYCLGTAFKLSEIVFDFLPFTELLFKKLKEALISGLTAPTKLFNPRPVTNVYIEPLKAYLKTSNININRTLLVGHTSGGTLAKLIGLGKGITTFAINSATIEPWYLSSYFNKLYYEKVTNLLLDGQLFAGAEEKATNEIIPFKSSNIKNPVDTSYIMCLVASQCGASMHFKEYCLNSNNKYDLESISDSSLYDL